MWSAKLTSANQDATLPIMTAGEVFRFAVLIIVGLILIGVLILIWRQRGPAEGRGRVSLVRSWIAVGLIFGLLMFCLLSFSMSDGGLRDTLMGGLTTSVGAAIAYYFSSKSGEQARQDLTEAMGARRQN